MIPVFRIVTSVIVVTTWCAIGNGNHRREIPTRFIHVPSLAAAGRACWVAKEKVRLKPGKMNRLAELSVL